MTIKVFISTETAASPIPTDEKPYTIREIEGEGFQVFDPCGGDIVGEYLPTLDLAFSAIQDEINFTH
jgi:hypothetical protein